MNQFNFNNQLKFEKLQFIDYLFLRNEEDVCDVFNTNICQVLTKLLMPDYIIARKSDNIIGDPDFAANFASDQLIMPIEIKRKHVLDAILNSAGVFHDLEYVCTE